MKKLNILAICLFASLLVACGGGSGSGEKYELCYKLEPGKTYNQTMSMDMKMKQDVMGQKMDIGTTMTFGFGFTIIDTLNGIISTDVSYNRIEMNMNTPMGDFTFSSEGTSTPNPAMPYDMSEMFRAMKQMTFSMDMNKYGEVIKISGFEEMMDDMFNSLSLPESVIADAKASMSQSFSEEKMMEQMQNMAIFPKSAVAVGDSWETTLSTDMMKMDNVYTLKKVTDNEAIIDVKSKVSIAMENASGKLSGDQTGTTTIHRASGWIKEAKAKQDLSGSINMQGMDVKVSMKSDILFGE